MSVATSFEKAQELDALDPLRAFRSRFFIPKKGDEEVVYFTGNSLGLQPRHTLSYLRQELDDWAALGVMGHTQAANPWVSYHEALAAPLGRIVGALPVEVVAMNQLTVNIHLLMASFYRPTPARYKIICEAKAFPSDQYALASQVALKGFDPSEAIIEVRPREGEEVLREEDILSTIEAHASELALFFFGGVNYYTGQVFPMEAISAAARKAGAYVGFDLAHAAGNIRLSLHDWDVDFACWCSYKYLNSGPGGVAGVYIHERHASNTELPRLSGWWGTNKQSRFRMEPVFDAIPTAEGWQLSNAPVLSMAAHRASLDLFEEAGMEALLEKSSRLTSFLFDMLEDINATCKEPVIKLLTPRTAHGCQVSLYMLSRGKAIFDALIAEGVVADWREPNVIRIAPVPFYNTFTDIWKFGQTIRKVLELPLQ
jgi:kynureninase